MLRIEEKKTGSKNITLKLDGKIETAYIEELKAICLNLMKKGRLTLDFQGVSYMDEESIAMLAKLSDRKLKIINCSPFISVLLMGTNIKRNSRSKNMGRY